MARRIAIVARIDDDNEDAGMDGTSPLGLYLEVTRAPFSESHPRTEADPMDGTLFLLDGMALVYRAYYALIRAPRMTTAGVNTSAPFGFANVLLDVLERHKPTHIAVAFDTPEPTERHRLFPEYKAQRQAMPEDLSDSLPVVDQLLDAFRIPILRCPGYEADDVIGTLAKQAQSAGMTTYMMTPDKDFAQLVGDRVSIYKPGRSGADAEILGPAQVLEQWAIERIDQVIDVLALWGDTSDNIPGIPGIGEKTAKKLIARFGSVENLIASVDQLKGKQQANVREFSRQALLAKRLVRIDTDVPVPVSLDQLRLRERDHDALRALLEKLEFRSLGQRLFGETFALETSPSQPSLFDQPPDANDAADSAGAALKTIRTVTTDYRIADTPAARQALAAELADRPAFCFDLETTGLDAKTTELVGIAFCWQTGTGHYVPFPEDRSQAAAILAEFASVWSGGAAKVGHNLKFDLTVLRWHGVIVAGPFFDTMLAHYVIEPELRHGMDELARRYLDYRPIPITDLIGDKTSTQRTMREVPVAEAAEYAVEDADITWQLHEVFRPMLNECNGARVFEEAECPLIPALTAMEFAGICIDSEALAKQGRELEREADALRDRVIREADTDFNLDSPKQLGHVLFNVLKLESKPRKTRTGQYATSEQVLQSLAARHPIVQDVLEFRQVRKLKNTYVDALPAAVFPGTGRLHTDYNQAVAVTGRLQSSNPNLQNIPIRTERGRAIRRAFVARDADHCLISADYSQIELRVIAELSGSPTMTEAFRSGADIHTDTAARVFNMLPELVTPDMRRQAKMVNFGIAYGISAFGLSQRLGIPRREAAAIITAYFRQYPEIQGYIDRTIAFAREHGYVETLLGRRRYLPEITSRNANARTAAERNAINSPVQGTAAEMIKLAMIHIHAALTAGGFRTRMLLQVHDELVFEAPRDEQEAVQPLIVDKMRNALPMQRVPIDVEVGAGDNWLQAH